MKPIIGIFSCGFMENRQFVTDSYIRAIRLSGGIPVILPILPLAGDIHSFSEFSDTHSASEGKYHPDDYGKNTTDHFTSSDMAHVFSPYLDLCHGFLLPGGGDFTPLLFGEVPVCDIGETSLALDLFQIGFTEAALKTKKPLLGICRGMQVLNAACGGTIYQDISLQPGKAFLHMQNSRHRSDVSHLITVDFKCTLHQITGDSIAVNSFHHQSIHTPGTHVEICARASDHTVEAIEITNHPFAIGVQWHPEAMFFTSVPMRNLFSLFIQKCTLCADTIAANSHIS